MQEAKSTVDNAAKRRRRALPSASTIQKCRFGHEMTLIRTSGRHVCRECERLDNQIAQIAMPWEPSAA